MANTEHASIPQADAGQQSTKPAKQDTFETGSDDDNGGHDSAELSRASIDMDDIPIELVSKIDK